MTKVAGKLTKEQPCILAHKSTGSKPSMICMTKVVRKLTKEQSCILAHKSTGNEPSNPHRLHQLGSPSEFCSIIHYPELSHSEKIKFWITV